MKTRKIPTTMATQHPDHASVPYWHGQAFISTAHETEECYLSFADLGVSEYKWDWEGKLVDEAVIDRLLSKYYDYFQKNPLGEEKFLTFRLPNPKVETEFRLGRAFMAMLSAASLSKHLGFKNPPLFEVILPMTESAEEMIAIEEAFAEIASLKHPLLKQKALEQLQLIPLFEQVDIIANAPKILKKYVKLHEKLFKKTPILIRPYLARSDPALNAGIVPTVLSIKLALSGFKAYEKESGIALFPIIGAASLPFRGGITPHTVSAFADEYRGIKTTTLQSSFRYDFPRVDVVSAIKLLDTLLPAGTPRMVSAQEEVIIRSLMKLFTPLYQEVIEDIADIVNTVSGFMPKRRERVQHVGLFGYSRGVGKVKLPRAIGFTGAMYALGIPPELIGTGRGIARAKEKGMLPTVEKQYIYLKNDLKRCGAYLNKNNLKKLAKKSKGFALIAEDVKEIEAYLGESFGLRTQEEKEHEVVTSKIYTNLEKNQDITKLIEKAALLRKSLG